jgi:hypothetical protein
MVPVMLATVICLTASAKEPSVEQEEGPITRYGENWAGPPIRVRRVIRNSALALILLLSFYYTVVSYYSSREAVRMASLFGGPKCGRMGRDLSLIESGMGPAFWRSDSYYACARERFMHVPVYIHPTRE